MDGGDSSMAAAAPDAAARALQRARRRESWELGARAARAIFCGDDRPWVGRKGPPWSFYAFRAPFMRAALKIFGARRAWGVS